MSQKRIRGITIEIGGDTKKLNDALKNVDKTISSTNTELKELQKALKLDPKNTELLAQKQELLEKQVKSTTERLNTLKEAQRQLGDYNSLTDEQKESYRALSIEISKAESNLNNLNDELKRAKTYNLSELNKSLADVREKSTQLVKELAKVGVAIGGILTSLGIASVKSYGEYEQLVGGIDTLFKESSKTVQEYAENAYKTAGKSANEYMETVTLFSASLIRSLRGDTEKASKYADMAITDMADNVNKLGTSIDMIQNAYSGFARGTFTMLDNLKLGYSGSREEMERLIEDANKIKRANGEMANLSIDNFSDMVEAIHIIQTEMGITGTTSQEAGKTILGSVKSMQSSWKNLLVSVSDDNADMGKSVDNFVDSVIVAAKNIVPRIKVAFDGISKLFDRLVREAFPKLKREIPELKPLINVFEWFINNKRIVVTAIKGIIAAFAVTKIIDFATKVQTAFNNVMKFAKGGTLNAVITGVTAAITVFTTLANIFDTETEAERKARIEMENHTDSLNSQIDSWQNLQEAQQETINNGMTELSYYSDLKRELEEITDENGNVQEGYEKRADFIVSQLKEALGIEIEYTDGVIENYKDISKSIDEVIEKKQAELIVNAQAGPYAEAKQKESEAISNLIYWEQELDKVKKEMQDNDTLRGSGMDAALELRYRNIKDNYEKQKEVVANYQYTIAQYEDNLVKIHEGSYDQINAKTWEYVKTYQNASDTQKAELEGNIELQKRKIEELEKAYKESGDEIYKTQIESAERELQRQEEDLKKYVSAINSKHTDVVLAGQNFMLGVVNGINNKKGDIFSTISDVGNRMLSLFKSSLKEQSPSKATKEMGEFLVEGLRLGIASNENALLNQVDSLGNSVISGLYDNTMSAMSGLGGKISTSLNPTINPSVSYEMNYERMANIMKKALEEVDVELDDRKIGKFINKAVSEEVFN